MGKKKSGLNNLVLISQLGINIMTPVFLCLLAGIFIDRRTGWNTILPLILVGVLSGCLSAYRVCKNSIEREQNESREEEKARLKEWQDKLGDSACSSGIKEKR